MNINFCTPLTPIDPVEPEGNGSTVSTELLSPVKCHPVSWEEIKERCIKLKQRLFVNEKDVDRIEKETVGQSANENWNMHRNIRITTSKCHRIATLQATTSLTKAIREVLQADTSNKGNERGFVKGRFCYCRIHRIKETGQSKCNSATLWTFHQ